MKLKAALQTLSTPRNKYTLNIANTASSAKEKLTDKEKKEMKHKLHSEYR